MALNLSPYQRLLREEFASFEVHLQHMHDRLNFIVGVCESMVVSINVLAAERQKLTALNARRRRQVAKRKKK